MEWYTAVIIFLSVTSLTFLYVIVKGVFIMGELNIEAKELKQALEYQAESARIDDEHALNGIK